MNARHDGHRFPSRSGELIFGPPDESGQRVVNNRRTGKYFRLGEQEHFLLDQLDGERSPKLIQRAYRDRFGERLAKEELLGFLDLADRQGLLNHSPDFTPVGAANPSDHRTTQGNRVAGGRSKHDEYKRSGTNRQAPASRNGQPAAMPKAASSESKGLSAASLLFWRKSLFDPDRLFDWLEPKIGFFWTPAFLALSALSILAAIGIVLADGEALANYFQEGVTWRTAVCAMATMVVVTILHEFAHGLTCKRYGGQVHEIGFLLLYFMPAFYCNVSDAWLFPQKSKRLWVTFAGGYFELFLWSLSAFVWRTTMQDTLVNYLAWMVVTISGVRVLFNFNPLLKLDGYYLLSDALGIANLRQASIGYLFAWLRTLLWGAPAPEGARRGKLLVVYGLASWAFSVVFLAIAVWAMSGWLTDHLGPPGLAVALLIGIQAGRAVFGGLLAGEVSNMTLARPARAFAWVATLAAVATGLSLVKIDKRASGDFEMRPATRLEVRAPVAGFLASVAGDEGHELAAQAVVARLEIPDLGSRIKQKQSELREVEAKLTLLERGARPEEIQEARARVGRASEWRNRAQADLLRNRQALGNDLLRLDQKIQEYALEARATAITLRRATNLVRDRVITQQQYLELDKNYRVAVSHYQQAVEEKKTRETLGTLEAETELASRQRELAEAEAALSLLLAGSRPEEIDAARASRARAVEELAYLHQRQKKLALYTPVSGVIVTHRLKEKIGQYFAEGDLVCEVEEMSKLETEISLPEQEAADVRPGQTVKLKARALPFKTFEAKVDRVAPRAKAEKLQSTVIAYCHLDHPDPELLPGMTGHARIYCDPEPAGWILLDKMMKFLRTEFWW